MNVRPKPFFFLLLTPNPKPSSFSDLGLLLPFQLSRPTKTHKNGFTPIPKPAKPSSTSPPGCPSRLCDSTRSPAPSVESPPSPCRPRPPRAATGGGGQVASPISPSKNILRFKTEHSGPNSSYSPSRCTAPTSPGSSPPPPTTPTVSSPPPPKTPSTPTTTKSPPPPKSPSTTPSTSSSSSSLDTRVIVGIAIGAIAILVVLSLYCIFCSKKKKRRREEPGYYVPPPTGPK